MAPLIDVVFLLLTFFVFSIIVLERVSVMDLDLPAVEAGSERTPQSPVVVAVGRDGMVSVAGRPVGSAGRAGAPLPRATRAAIARAVGEAGGPAGTPDGPVVRLEVDERGVSGALLRVLDGLRAEGINAVQVVGRPTRDAQGQP